jgi:plasmid stabilization system protein ParE
MAEVLFSDFVEADLGAIWDYIALDNIDAADRFLDATTHCLEELSRVPEMGPARLFAEPRVRYLRQSRRLDVVSRPRRLVRSTFLGIGLG